MAVFEIPLGPSPRSMTIDLGGTTYKLRFAWADAPDGGWFMDVSDSSGNPLACGIPLVTGSDLLAQFGYLGIAGPLYVVTDGDPGAIPTFDNLGIESHLYFESN